MDESFKLHYDWGKYRWILLTVIISLFYLSLQDSSFTSCCILWRLKMASDIRKLNTEYKSSRIARLFFSLSRIKTTVASAQAHQYLLHMQSALWNCSRIRRSDHLGFLNSHKAWVLHADIMNCLYWWKSLEVAGKYGTTTVYSRTLCALKHNIRPNWVIHRLKKQKWTDTPDLV